MTEDHVVTKNGSKLPLLNLKGKKYLMIAYRIQWFNEENSNFTVQTEFPLLTENETVARASINIFDKEGKPVKSATATKRETKKDFPDHSEKAETGAIGRALLLLGYGTQFALSDLNEGHRLADSPLVDTRSEKKAPATEVSVFTTPIEISDPPPATTAPAPKSSFRKKPAEAAPPKEAKPVANDDWV